MTPASEKSASPPPELWAWIAEGDGDRIISAGSTGAYVLHLVFETREQAEEWSAAVEITAAVSGRRPSLVRYVVAP